MFKFHDQQMDKFQYQRKLKISCVIFCLVEIPQKQKVEVTKA